MPRVRANQPAEVHDPNARPVVPKEESKFTEAAPVGACPVDEGDKTRKLIQKNLNSAVNISYEKTGKVGFGSGVILHDSGIILTNDHVVRKSEGENITVEFYTKQGEEPLFRKAKLLLLSQNHDLAILKVDLPEGYHAIELWQPSDAIKSIDIGHPIGIIGNPKGQGFKANCGIISGIESPEINGRTFNKLFTIDARVNPGNSGGLVFDRNTGSLVGIVVAMDTQADGINYILPLSYLEDLRTKFLGKVLGASVDGTSLSILAQDGPAAKAKMKAGDRITILNPNFDDLENTPELKDTNELFYGLLPLSGQLVPLEVKRNESYLYPKIQLDPLNR